MSEQVTTVIVRGGDLGFLARFARRRYKEFKNCFDIFLGALGLSVSAPIIALLGILIKLTSPGPIFYTQERVGQGGKPFKLIKLRTMRVDAEAKTGPVWASPDDPRITPLGRILRKLHLDELPQFINVVMGQMSVIGPRPERPVFVEEFKKTIPDYELWLSVKPGITGLAQVRHRADQSINDGRRKLKYDLLYLEKMCWLLDLRILGLTILKMARG
ncbi:MAG TPA: sugar transferase [Candidatus Hypogeohydataceae bacterium YC41]